MKIQQINHSLLISLPKSICNAKQWKKGSELKYEIDSKGRLVLFD